MARWNQSDLPEEPVARNERVNKIPVKLLLQQTYSLRRASFWRHFMTAWPPSVFAVLVYAGGDAVLRSIFSTVRYDWASLGGAEYQRRLLIASLEALPVRLLQVGLPWIITAFAFAALSSRLLPASSENQHRIMDAYSSARERLRPIIMVGLITFALTLIGAGISLFGALTLGGRARILPEYRLLVIQTILWVCLGGWLTLVSRLGLSIPCMMDKHQVTAWSAIKSSFRLSDGYERLFLIFVAQTIGLSILMQILDKTVSFLLWKNHVSWSVYSWSAYVWSTRGLYSILTALLETSIFIGFTVLYLEVKDRYKENDQDEVSSAGISAAALSPR